MTGETFPGMPERYVMKRGDDVAGAAFSNCERYRFELWRVWNDKRAQCMFIMLNPSTADEVKLDPTVTRCRNFAEGWGYGGLTVCNIFAWRATKPEDMKAQADPVGWVNDETILVRAMQFRDAGGIVIAAWSQHGKMMGRGEAVRAMLRKADVKLHYLRMGASGMPHHPLYLPAALTPTEWV